MIFCTNRLLKRTRIPAPVKIKQSIDVPIFSAKLKAQAVCPAVSHSCAADLQDVPDVFRAVAGLGTGVGEEQMHHPLLLNLLWGQISWGRWGESNLLNQRSRNPQGTLNLCSGSLG